MIAKLMKSAGVMNGVLNYNESKVKLGVAQRVAAENFPVVDPNEKAIRDTFRILENANIRTKNVSFHLTVNPDPDDPRLSDEALKAIVKKTLEALGYGTQPYVIYRHEDNGREHFHIVSTTILPDGRRVKGSNEEYRLLATMRALGREYGFRVGKKRRSERVKDLREENAGRIAPVFNPKTRNVKESLAQALRDTFLYSFNSREQFENVLAQHGAKAYFIPSAGGKYQIALRGTDRYGNAVTPILLEEETQMQGAFEKLQQILSASGRQTKEDRKESLSYRKELKGVLEYALEKSTSEAHFLALCARQGLGLTLHRTSDDEGKIFGVSVVDHVDKAVWKASEIDREFTARLNEKRAHAWKDEPSAAQSTATADTPEDIVEVYRNTNFDSRREYDRKDNRKTAAAIEIASDIIKTVIAGTYSTTRKPRRRRSVGLGARQ